MAPRCYPQQSRFESSAEQRVWQALHDRLPADAVLVANQRFTDRHGDCEADLVVAIPGAGIAVVEVKGGHVTHDGEGWRQRGGGVDKQVDPVDQGRRAKYALRSFLDRHPAWGSRRVRMLHAVALPGTTVTTFVAPDLPREHLLDRDDVPDAAARLRAALLALHDERPAADADDAGALLAALTDRLLPQRDHVAEARANEEQCDFLTAEQASVLDHIRSLSRVEIRGGAGSGKTWLAVEKARRLAREGRRVGLLCYSRGLAAYLRRRVQLLPARERPSYVGTFHYLGVQWGAAPGSDDDSDYFERRLPEEMVRLARHLVDSERFDAFVVDEGQDFADGWWPALIAGLRDPDHGALVVFADEGQRVFGRQGRPPVGLVPISLDENLRNTKQIAQTFGSLAPAQMRYRGADGVPVRFVPCSTGEAVGVADDEAVALLDDGWAPEHVALLTTGSRHPEHSARQAHGQEDYWESYWSGEDLFYGHVLGFKGLERPAVVLAVNGFRDESRAREMLYVGLSRARDLLVVCGDPTLVRRLGGEAVARRLGIA